MTAINLLYLLAGFNVGLLTTAAITMWMHE